MPFRQRNLSDRCGICDSFGESVQCGRCRQPLCEQHRHSSRQRCETCEKEYKRERSNHEPFFLFLPAKRWLFLREKFIRMLPAIPEVWEVWASKSLRQREICVFRGEEKEARTYYLNLRSHRRTFGARFGSSVELRDGRGKVVKRYRRGIPGSTI